MDIHDAIRRRRMVRAYRTDPVEEHALRRILEAACRAPSAGASQIRDAFGVPDGFRALGGITIGHPRPEPPVTSTPAGRRSLDDVVHRGRW